MKKFVLAFLGTLLMMVIEIPLAYPQAAPKPFRIGGTVTIDGVQITQATDQDILITVTKPDGTDYIDANGNTPEDEDGLNANNWYMIDIPIYEATIQPDGAKPGETAIIHVYKDDQELWLTTPRAGQITIGEEGTVSRIDLTAATTGPPPSQMPNLTPYQPQGWSDKIVVSKTTGTTTDSSPLYTTDTLYVDWAVSNESSVDITMGFYVSLYVDGTFTNSWYFDSLNAYCYGFLKDYSIGNLGAGSHTLRVVADPDQRIKESNETDNQYTKTITVLSQGPSNGLPNLTPYKPSGWSDALVVSTSPGIYTDSTSYTDQNTLYISWAVINDGPVATPEGFSVDLYIDGMLEKTWSYSSPLKPNTYWYLRGYSIETLFGGFHTIKIVIDRDHVISESNEDDNMYTKNILVKGVLFYEALPNLTPYQPEGWSDKIVVSSSRRNSKGSNSFTSKEKLYIDWAVINNGETGTSQRVSVSLYVDGVLKKTWKIPPLKGSGVEPFSTSSSMQKTYYTIKRYPIGKLGWGDHTLTIVIDPKGVIREGDKGDNEYNKVIRIVETP